MFKRKQQQPGSAVTRKDLYDVGMIEARIKRYGLQHFRAQNEAAFERHMLEKYGIEKPVVPACES